MTRDEKKTKEKSKDEEEKRRERTTTMRRMRMRQHVLMCACGVILVVGALWQIYGRALDGVEAYTDDEKNPDANAVYSLWLTPSESREKGGGAGDVLVNAIRETATRRRTPNFPPHVTLTRRTLTNSFEPQVCCTGSIINTSPN